mmetsp:Transcript_777/g.1398  ORF Transcript_777/g.1398 Transcript_777/m.1398 type:complete len:93 (+) Transcript_777:100-378(+)
MSGSPKDFTLFRIQIRKNGVSQHSKRGLFGIRKLLREEPSSRKMSLSLGIFFGKNSSWLEKEDSTLKREQTTGKGYRRLTCSIDVLDGTEYV